VTLSAVTTANLTGTTTTATGTKVSFMSSNHTIGTGATGQTGIVVADATNIAVGDLVYGTGIAANTTVAAVSGTTITLSANTTC
jgi:hypothetical protein